MSQTHAQPEEAFGDAAIAVLRDLRRSTAGVLTACSGMERPVDVSTRLGLDRSLAWKIWQVAAGAGPCPSAAHIPGRQGFERFLESASKAGVDEGTIHVARDAFRAFQKLTTVHAGDRASVDIMLGTLTDEGRTRLEMALRRDGFRANAHFLGAQVGALYQMDVVLPPRSGFMPDVARVRGHFGLRRNRAGASLLIARTTLVSAEGANPAPRRVPLTAIAPTIGSHDALPALLQDFCSRPTPGVTRRTIQGVTVEDELVPGEVGQLGALDVVTGELMAEMRERPVDKQAVTMLVPLPSERLCYDVLLPRAFVFDAAPAARVHSTMQTDLPYLRREDFDAIPVPEHLEALGSAATAPPSPDIPHHPEMLAWVLKTLGRNAAEFDLYRLRMRFPPAPSCVGVAYSLRKT
jgi:hypothetical protein